LSDTCVATTTTNAGLSYTKGGGFIPLATASTYTVSYSAIAYNGSTIIIAGSSTSSLVPAKIIVSTDMGASFNVTYTSENNRYLYSAQYFNGYFYVGSSASNLGIKRSSNGISWENVALPENCNATFTYDKLINYNGYLYTMFSYISGNRFSEIHRTSDGITWEMVYRKEHENTYALSTMAIGNDIIVGVYSNTLCVKISVDGSNIEEYVPKPTISNTSLGFSSKIGKFISFTPRINTSTSLPFSMFSYSIDGKNWESQVYTEVVADASLLSYTFLLGNPDPILSQTSTKRLYWLV
jgi:hypothetical protein